MATYHLSMTGTGPNNLSFLAGSTEIDPDTGLVSSYTPIDSSFSGTVSQPGNSSGASPIWFFVLANGGSRYVFNQTVKVSNFQYTGQVNGNPNPHSPDDSELGNETDDWVAVARVPETATYDAP